MDWLHGKGVDRPATEQAVRIADRLALPFHAWSKTRAEVARMHRWALAWTVIFVFALTVPIVWGAYEELEREPLAALAIIGVVGLGGVLFVLFTWIWARRAADYRDPAIMIDVREDGLVLRCPEAVETLGWGEIQAELRFQVTKGSLRFVGVEMASRRHGQIRLEDDWYRNGRLAAAVIVRGMHTAHDARQKARIERIG